jgi:hypothetical protein
MTSFTLGFPKRGYVRIALAAVPLGLSLEVFWLAYQVATGQTGDYAVIQPPDHLVSLVVCLGLSIAAACGLFALRERGARVTWDAHGVTEWIGDGPRVAIAWSDAKVSRTRYLERTRAGGRHDDGAVEQIEDSRGRRITIASTFWGAPSWLLRRRCEGATGVIPQLAGLPAGPGVVADERTTRSVSRWTWILRLGYAPLFLMCVALVDHDFYLRDPTLVILAIVTPPLLLRVVRPVAELVRLTREGRRYRRARRVELVGHRETLVTAREADGRTLTFDAARLHHDDALLPLRRGAVWIVAPSPIPTDASPQLPYRHQEQAAAPVEVALLEHDGVRRARTALVFAVLLEIAVRTAFAFYPPIACARVHAADEEHRLGVYGAVSDPS